MNPGRPLPPRIAHTTPGLWINPAPRRIRYNTGTPKPSAHMDDPRTLHNKLLPSRNPAPDNRTKSHIISPDKICLRVSRFLIDSIGMLPDSTLTPRACLGRRPYHAFPRFRFSFSFRDSYLKSFSSFAKCISRHCTGLSS